MVSSRYLWLVCEATAVKFTPFAAVTSTNLPGVAAGGAVNEELCPRSATGAQTNPAVTKAHSRCLRTPETLCSNSPHPRNVPFTAPPLPPSIPVFHARSTLESGPLRVAGTVFHPDGTHHGTRSAAALSRTDAAMSPTADTSASFPQPVPS